MTENIEETTATVHTSSRKGLANSVLGTRNL
ncbi:ABC transporter permease, partial [Mobiluncus curtisii]|nr:ABC transporter permease [Mobiluncus curtisii]MCV0022158.1 ABC transporter permease [Mobiluncus curtisii]